MNENSNILDHFKDTVEEAKYFNDAWLLLIVQYLLLLLQQQEYNLQSMLWIHIREQNRLNRNLPTAKVRPSWQEFQSRISESIFRRMFRMKKEVFAKLCDRICGTIGKESFWPEEISAERAASNKCSAAHDVYGGMLPGEILVAITLRFLAGGSYLDLSPIFVVCKTSIYDSIEKVVEWIRQTFQFVLPGLIETQNWDALQSISNEFSKKTSGIMSGIIGALDGLAIRIRSPKLKEVTDPGNYWCRKGFFALNVQAIVDRFKRFTWCRTMNKGSSHDSAAFGDSELMKLLKKFAKDLEDHGFFIVGLRILESSGESEIRDAILL